MNIIRKVSIGPDYMKCMHYMLGQEVLRTAPNNVNSTVDMSAFQTGAYFVKVTINDRTETIRVIKQ